MSYVILACVCALPQPMTSILRPPPVHLSAAIVTAKAKSWLSTVEFTFILAAPATDGRYKGSAPTDNGYGGYDGSVGGRGEGGGQGGRAQGPPRMMLPHSPMMAREPSNHSARSNGSNQDSRRWGRGDSGRFRSSHRSSRGNSEAAEEEMPAPPPLVSTPSTHSVHESASMSNTNLSLILERGQAAMHLQTQNCCICYDSKPLGLSCDDDDTPHFICRFVSRNTHAVLLSHLLTLHFLPSLATVSARTPSSRYKWVGNTTGKWLPIIMEGT